MWQSPEDPNNPWQPFRAGASFNIRNESFASQPHNCFANEYHSDENWNSVNISRNNINGHNVKEKETVDRSHINEIAQIQHVCRLKNKPESFYDCQNKYDGQKTMNNNHFEEYNFRNHNESAPNVSSLAGTFQGNEWSPFLHEYKDVSFCQSNVRVPGLPRERDVSWSPEQVHFDYRKPTADDTYHSERSSYSTDTDEDGDGGYELVEHQHACQRDNNENVIHRKHYQKYGDPYNTPPTSLSVNDTYHTAPNSPRSEHDFCIVPYPEDFDQTLNVKQETVETQHESACYNVVNGFEYRDQTGSTPVVGVAANANVEEPPNVSNDERTACSLETFTENITACLEEAINESHLSYQEKQDIVNFRRFSERFDRSRTPKMELPPFIEVESVQYEADPKTGAVRTVGKGSFGQVFKARFADPALQHLRIVVKEFNEEYTNRQEILDEAKRLLYLGDTGYVPICYGLVCLGDVSNPTYGLVQEYVGSGLTLEQVLWDQYDLEIHLWLSIAFQACEGLARFHEKGILLNDIKSNNIILEFFRNIVRIKYIDFGLATDMRGKRYKNTKSLEDYIYLAPEVRKDGCRTNIASDIFSLGYMLEQICSIAGVHELGFMTRLCMDLDPDSRLPVRGAANIIYEHMVTFNFDISSLSR